MGCKSQASKSALLSVAANMTADNYSFFFRGRREGGRPQQEGMVRDTYFALLL